MITGSFTVQSASDLALLLRAGALPAPIDDPRGAHGRRRASAPIRSTPAPWPASSGSALVVVFMVLFYGLFGVFADIALFFNLCLMLGACRCSAPR